MADTFCYLDVSQMSLAPGTTTQSKLTDEDPARLCNNHGISFGEKKFLGKRVPGTVISSSLGVF
jgi:hypothetical protein